MKKTMILFVLAFVFAGLAIYQYTQNGSDSVTEAAADSSVEFKPKAGSKSLSFELPGLGDETYAVGGEGEKLTLVNFWASWCGPCELEAPDLQKLYTQYGDRIALYGVNATNFDKERSAREFVEEQGFTFPILMDRDGNITKAYKVNAFPTTFVIDSEGIIRERVNGVITYEEWQRMIEKWA
ncbi:TlpA disulfide reductase family protein [Paenibacillus sp. HB172176]|uniref:TlpA family protein disulfide reductase n=1 Tax=Paenibacillus sp. HB172176 TaxID=2493690 RepID=UPI0014397573|nr:TlpA disulfide reductase family protein [Paenibacillus sp. HB172176]